LEAVLRLCPRVALGVEGVGVEGIKGGDVRPVRIDMHDGGCGEQLL